MYDAQTEAWTPLDARGLGPHGDEAPAPRMGHSATLIGKDIYVFGGILFGHMGEMGSPHMGKRAVGMLFTSLEVLLTHVPTRIPILAHMPCPVSPICHRIDFLGDVGFLTAKPRAHVALLSVFLYRPPTSLTETFPRLFSFETFPRLFSFETFPRLFSFETFPRLFRDFSETLLLSCEAFSLACCLQGTVPMWRAILNGGVSCIGML